LGAQYWPGAQGGLHGAAGAAACASTANKIESEAPTISASFDPFLPNRPDQREKPHRP
jgi:hypothetical protein